MTGLLALTLAVLGSRVGSAQNKQDKYTLSVPGGLAFSEFKGYEDWQAVGPSQTDAANLIRLILANPMMIAAYKDGVPGNGKPFPDGSRIAKIESCPYMLPLRSKEYSFFHAPGKTACAEETYYALRRSHGNFPPCA